MYKQILKISAIAGSLDITAACIQAYLSGNVAPAMVLKYIASGIYGAKAFSGGFEFILLGLLVHFLIAFSCTVVFFLFYPKFKLLHKNIFLNSFIIAVVAWTVTTQIIIPFSRIHKGPFHLSKVVVAIAILYCCIGLPIAYFTERYYRKG